MIQFGYLSMSLLIRLATLRSSFQGFRDVRITSKYYAERILHRRTNKFAMRLKRRPPFLEPLSVMTLCEESRYVLSPPRGVPCQAPQSQHYGPEHAGERDAACPLHLRVGGQTQKSQVAAVSCCVTPAASERYHLSTPLRYSFISGGLVLIHN